MGMSVPDMKKYLCNSTLVLGRSHGASELTLISYPIVFLQIFNDSSHDTLEVFYFVC